MSEATKDPAIKLFGRTIPFPDAYPPSLGASAAEPPEAVSEEAGEEQEAAADVSGSDAVVSGVDATEGVKDVSEMGAGMEIENLNIVADSDKGKESTQIISSSVSSVNEDDHKAYSEDENGAPNTEAEFSKAETDGPVQEKLKKPDKILPCPRCNSMDTKFCYYNNYNINQPRHFCKNCQRYWTAGGTMRNVPVGAGRRKSKHSSSQYRQVMMPSEGLQSPRLENPDLAHHHAVSCGPSTSSRSLTSNGTVLKFGQEVPLCESMASVLNIREQKRNGGLNSAIARENKEEPSCASSVTASNGVTNPVEQIQQNGTQSYCNGVTPIPHFQCYSGAPWPYPWHPGWNNIAAMAAARCPSELVCKPENSTPSPVPWVAPPAFCPPALPFPFMPPSFWGCVSSWPNAAWNIPWVGSNGGISPTSSTSNSGCSGNSSPTLGKHSRDASLQGEEKTEKSLWIPKTLRIDDPDEAAKSSIWSTLGIKPDEGGIFKSFQSKAVKKGQTSDAAQVLHANPAALSRSQSFQEST